MKAIKVNSKAWILATSSQAAYRNGKEAVALAQKAVKMNAGIGPWHRVFIGSYRSPAEAHSAAADLKKRKIKYAQVTHKPYTVQVGLFDSEPASDQVTTRLRTKGYITYRLPDRNRPEQTRLVIGAYGTRDAAQGLAEQLKQDGIHSRILPR